MKEKAYYENVNVKNEVKLRKLLEQLPDFCKQFFIGIEPTTVGERSDHTIKRSRIVPGMRDLCASGEDIGRRSGSISIAASSSTSFIVVGAFWTLGELNILVSVDSRECCWIKTSIFIRRRIHAEITEKVAHRDRSGSEICLAISITRTGEVLRTRGVDHRGKEPDDHDHHHELSESEGAPSSRAKKRGKHKKKI